jgi:hypothetical protein
VVRERALDAEYDRLWLKECESVVGRLSVPERVRFRLLHRQFFGPGVPGFGRAMQAARLAWNRIKRGVGHA